MAKLKLTKALSWASGSYTATRDAPFLVVPDSEADAFLESGYFVPVDDPLPGTESEDCDSMWDEMPEYEPMPSSGTITKWDTWNVKQLRQYAQTHGIELHGASTKAAIVDAIVKATESDAPEYDGDPTMIALQES